MKDHYFSYILQQQYGTLKKTGGFFRVLLAVFRSMFKETEMLSAARISQVNRQFVGQIVILPAQARTHSVKSEMFFDESKHRLKSL